MEPPSHTPQLPTIPVKMTELQNQKIVREIKEEKIEVAVMNLVADQVLGPDGFQPMFFQIFWPIVKNDIIAVKEFFATGQEIGKILIYNSDPKAK